MCSHPRSRLAPLLALAAALLVGCGGAPYVWIDELRQPHAANEYVIATGDLVGVRVFNQESLSTRARVRSDGRIAVPFLGDVELRGRTPAVVSKELGVR